jgi:hypothetical protein
MELVEVSSEMSAGDLLVGAGTLLLAVFTAWLAFRTSQQVKLTRESLGLSRESIEALDRPFVIATPNEHHRVLGFLEPGPEHPGLRFAYRLWNIGKGPAIVTDVSLVDPSTGREYLTEAEKVQRAIAVAPAGRDELSPLVRGAPGIGAKLKLRVNYQSASGMAYSTESNVAVVENLYCICQDFRRTSGEGM